MSIEVYGIGTQVTIDGDIPATISGIAIYSGLYIKYLCVWWDERVRREEWIMASEVQLSDGSGRTEVRFK